MKPFSFKSTRVSKKRIIILGAVAVIAVCLVIFALFYFNRPYSLTYTVKPLSVADQTVQVTIKVNKGSLFAENNIMFDQIQFTTDIACSDSKGDSVAYEQNGGLLTVPVKNTDQVNITYTVTLGTVAKHGHQGAYYDDLLVFGGKDVLMFPHVAAMGITDDIRKYIHSITIAYETPDNWTSVIPFAETGADGKPITRIKSPSGADIYQLMQAGYTFGRFTEKNYKTGTQMFSLYIDQLCDVPDPDLIDQGIKSIYDYYSGLFGYCPDKLSVVLLRKDPDDGQYIIGGGEAQVMSTTFDPDVARDWQLIGHRMFHDFFDVYGDPVDFLQPDRVWFMEGLATYYENMSMDALPDAIKVALGLNGEDGILSLYKTYVYFYEKDSDLRIAPLSEADPSIQQNLGLIEFLHYTQAPLIIKAIEDLSYAQYGSHNRMLEYIISQKKCRIHDIEDIVTYAIGDSAQTFAQYYLENNGLLPLWYLADGTTENPLTVLYNLNTEEYTLFTWFSQGNSLYAMDNITGQNLDAYVKAAQDRNISFTDEDTENSIMALSPMVYAQLLKWALRANVCGVSPDDQNTRQDLLQNQNNVDKWSSYEKTIIGN